MNIFLIAFALKIMLRKANNEVFMQSCNKKKPKNVIVVKIYDLVSSSDKRKKNAQKFQSLFKFSNKNNPVQQKFMMSKMHQNPENIVWTRKPRVLRQISHLFEIRATVMDLEKQVNNSGLFLTQILI